jgi:predicted nucleic acid-binding protein
LKSVLCDINFILDIFLKREPFYAPSARLFALIEKKKLRGFLSAQSFPILYYLLSREVKRDKAFRVLEKLQIVFSIAAVDEKVIRLSLASDFKDFEDAVQYYSALQAGADFVITRNKQDYKSDRIPVMTPEEFLAAIKS